jgi:hypothetical protein
VAGNLQTKYGTSNQTITITLASLVQAAARQSTVIDNTTNVFTDALVTVKLKTGAGTSANQKAFNVYAFATTDGGTTYTENAGASDAAITLTSPPNAVLIGVISTPSASTTYVGGPFSIASAFGGSLPDHWGIIVENQEGQTSDATGGNFLVTYQGVYGQYT